ncbi:unnamed protein product [Urochloa humidicola]
MNSNTVNYSLLTWNVRGLGDSDKCKSVRDVLLAAKLDIACLQETKLVGTDSSKARAFLPTSLSAFSCVDADGTRGGLITAWNACSVTMTSVLTRDRSLTVFFSSTASDYAFAVTNVYAPADHSESQAFLLELEALAAHIPGNWVIAGDFNLTRGAADNSNGTVHQALANAFNDTIHKLGLIDLPLVDRLFTWSNHRDHPTLARLDRVFFNVSMSTTFPNSSLLSLPKPTSDHTPLRLSLTTSIPKPNLFRFENSWLKNRDFLSSVLPAWHGVAATDAAGALVGSLKAVRCASKVWARGKRTPPSLQANCKFVIYMFDVLEEGRFLSTGELVLRQACRDRLALAVREQAAYWKQRGKCRAIREGDSNTRFFHAQASHRLRRNNIRLLEVNGTTVSSHSDKARALSTHLRTLLARVPRAGAVVNIAALYTHSKVSNPERLIAEFTEQEALTAVRAMNRNSSPGPDGFGPSFYVAAWNTVAERVLRFAAAFHSEQAELERLNRSYIVMLPKRPAAVKVGDYRPICLQNCSLKIVAKMLTSRLQLEIPALIDVDQTGFLKGRSISENFVYALELVQCCNKRKIPTLVLKLDFAKAFDSVDWDSLTEVLRARGFPEKWCRWIRSMLDTSVSEFGVHPIDLINQNKPIHCYRMANPFEHLVLHCEYQRYSHEEIPKIRVEDVIYGSVKHLGKSEFLAWVSAIPPYHSYVVTCEVRELKHRGVKRKRCRENRITLC